jgi:hypothetical protein
MKGSAIRSNNLAKPIYPLHSEQLMPYHNLAIIQEKKDGQSPGGNTAQNRDSLDLTPPKR